MNGTMVIATSPDGYVQGCEADFDQSKPAGFSLELAQERRARRRLAFRIVHHHCSEHLSNALTGCAAMEDRVMEALRRNGWRFEVQQISAGQGDET